MSKIVGIKRDETGSICKFKLDNGQVVNREQAVDGADNGSIEGVASFETRDGERAIRSNRGQEGYSLDSLPEF